MGANKLAGVVLASGLWLAQQAQATEEFLVLASFESRTFSEPTSIDSFLHDFRGDIRSGNYAFTFNRAELGLRYGNLSVNYVTRYDYFVRFSESFARAYHASQHDQTLQLGQTASADLDASHIRASGLKVGYQFSPVKAVRLGMALTQLSADKMVDGGSRGTLAFLENDRYSGDVNINMLSSRDLLLEMEVPDPQGSGYALDTGFDWQLTERWQLSLQVFDAWSRIDWENVLYSDINANTANVSFDADGHIHTRPTLWGYQFLKNADQKLPVKYQVGIVHQLDEHHGIYLEQFHVPDYVSESTLGYRYQWTESLRLGGYWNLSTRALGLTFGSKWLDVKVGVDDLDGTEAHAWDLGLAFRIPLM